VLFITVVLLHKIFTSETSTNNALKGATEATCESHTELIISVRGENCELLYLKGNFTCCEHSSLKRIQDIFFLYIGK
jgi:hypothetical protein